MHLLELTAKINKIEIVVKLSNHRLLDHGSIINVDKAHKIILKEFSTDLTFEESAQRILNALQSHCYEVTITPPINGYNYKYNVSCRK